MKKTVIRFICIVLCVLLPFLTLITVAFALPTQFDQTFLGELSAKIDRLYNVEGRKIVIIGGSSVPFGVNSELLEKALGIPVVNFGLYATLGTKLMLDLSRGAIHEGDIVIIAAETDAQTYSLYFNAESVWQACDSDYSILTKISSDNYDDMLGGFWKYLGQKIKYASQTEHLNPSGIYNKASFNEYGDIAYDRPYNIMALDYDPSMIIKFDTDIISRDYVDYVNDYTEYAESKGATVLLSFSPMNEKAIDESTTMEDLNNFTSFISENFEATLISNPNNYLYRSGYFYDSNYHMNNAGMILHTRNLANDISKALGIELQYQIEKPAVPEKPAEDDEPDLDYDANEVYFTFAESYSGGVLKGYTISGTTELGKQQSVLTTPNAYNGMRIFSLDENTFSGCDKLTEVYITKNIGSIGDGAFAGAPNLKKIHVLATDPNDTTVNNVSGDLTKGMASGCRFYVPDDSYNDYIGNYFWGPYQDYITKE